MRGLLNDLDAGKESFEQDPVKRTQAQMKAPVVRRFYEAAYVEPTGEGFAVTLDGKSVRTPARSLLVLPGEAAARLVADEFSAQTETIEPVTMPVLRLVNTAIDGVAADRQAVIEDILRFASSDLVCYRADAPQGLVERQAQHWDPVVDWAHAVLGARFFLAEGIVHVEQPRETIGAIGIHLRQRDEPLKLAALHLMTSITGSALLAFAVETGALDVEGAWTAAHVDEDWNIAQWGEDPETAARRAMRKRDMMAAVRLLEALRA